MSISRPLRAMFSRTLIAHQPTEQVTPIVGLGSDDPYLDSRVHLTLSIPGVRVY